MNSPKTMFDTGSADGGQRQARKAGGRSAHKKRKQLREGVGAMDNRLKAVYLKGYLAGVKALIETLKKQQEKIEAEIECCLKREEE